jgi:hypothetical protein
VHQSILEKEHEMRGIADHPVFQYLGVHHFTGRSVSRRRIQKRVKGSICRRFVPYLSPKKEIPS